MHDELKPYVHFMAPQPTGEAFRGSIAGRLEVVLFDIYGTLFISGSGDLGTAMRNFAVSTPLAELLRRYGLDDSPAGISQKLWAEIDRQHTAARQHGVDHPEVEIDRIWQIILKWPDHQRVRQFAEAYEMIVNPVFPMPGLERVLRSLRRRGRRLGLISNAQFFTPRLFAYFLGARPQALGFAADLLIYSYREGCAKPSRRLFQRARDALQCSGIAPERVLFVGNDMHKDVLPAARIGFQTALFAGDRRSLRWGGSPQQKSDAPPPPDLVITDLQQLLDLPSLAN
jgi:putative hydrolase of the HAD superfamily